MDNSESVGVSFHTPLPKEGNRRMKCISCGADIVKQDDGRYYCDYCHSHYMPEELGIQPETGPAEEKVLVKEIHHYHGKNPDKLSVPLGCLSFFFFPVGWVIWFLYKDSHPSKARMALLIAVISTALIAFSIFSGGRG